MKDIRKKMLTEYRDSMIDFEHSVNGASCRDISVIFGIAESTAGVIIRKYENIKRVRKLSQKKPLESERARELMLQGIKNSKTK